MSDCTNIVLQNGTALGHGHQLWQMNEINKLVWPNSSGIGHVPHEVDQHDGADREDLRRDQEAAEERGHVPVRRPGARPAEGAGVDIYGLKYKPAKVTVTAGGK